MRALIVLLLATCLVLLVLLLMGLAGVGSASRRDRAGARWKAVNVGQDGRTTVLVALTTRRDRVLESRALLSLSDVDPDYDSMLLEAMAQARSRAAVLNLELD